MDTTRRWFSSLPAAAVATAVLFLILAALIRQQGDVQLTEDRSVDINITRQILETQQTQEADFKRPVLDRPPPPPPMVQDLSFRPTVSGQLGALPDFSRTDLNIGAGFNPDRDAQPLVRIPPQYPDRCQQRAAAEEHVVVTFDVTPEGAVVNARVLDSTNTCFHSAAIRSVERWKYQPKIVDGKAQPRRGVQTQITFQLEK